MNFGNAFHYFRENYKGWKLSFYLTGGGICIADFLKMSGGGRFIHAIYMPYDAEAHATLQEIGGNHLVWNYPSVSKEAVIEYDSILKNLNRDDRILRVVASCALTTTRYRRGDNKAIISFIDDKGNQRIWKLLLKKIEEKEHNELVEKAKNAPKNNPEFWCIDTIRYREDEKVGQSILYAITEDETLKPLLELGESLERVN